MSTPATPDLIHPLAIQDEQRIDILYGGSEAEVLKESAALSRDLLTHGLKEGEQMLYLNTLVSTRVFETQSKRVIRDIRQRYRFNWMTVLDESLVQKIEFITKLIETRSIRYVILNGFEFATFSSRHRIQIFAWIKSLRDSHGVSVIVFTQSGPRKYGTLGQMRFLSETCEEVGAYIREKQEAERSKQEGEEKAAREAEAARPKSELEILEAKVKRHPDGEPIYFIDKMKLQWAREKEEAAKLGAETPESETLKTKDLDLAIVAS